MGTETPSRPNTRSSVSKSRAAGSSQLRGVEEAATGDGPESSGTLRSTRGVSGNLPPVSVNERILRDCHEIYANAENGLCRIATMVGHHLLPPRRRIIVLLIGNHSAGKSSYINWYIEEHIQRTGVAIETQGFTFVTSGRKRETLKGDATLEVFKRFQALADIDGVVEYLQTEVSTSKEKRFPLVTFIDTPGLVDGDMFYPFDVNKAILWFGNHADLIFVFFDPIGQALCKRTMTLVEKLNDKHADKMRFYLSKADEAGDETDRQRVMMQIVQELCKRPGLNRTGFDMPTVYVPNPLKASRCANQIENTCREINKSINHTVQQTLNCLGTDTETLVETINSQLTEDQLSFAHNRKSSLKRTMAGVLTVLLAAIVFINFCVVFPALEKFVSSMMGKSFGELIRHNAKPVGNAWNVIPEDWRILSMVFLLITAIGVILSIFKSSPQKSRLSRKKRKQLDDALLYLQQHVVSRKKQLYQQYLDESVGENAV